MRRFKSMQVVMASMVVVGAFVLSNGVAAASPKEYRAGMVELVPEANAWVAELETTLGAAMSKPELACGAQMAELALRGDSLVSDLEGTGRNVPAALASQHEQMTGAVQVMSQAAGSACGDAAGAVGTVAGQRDGYNRAMFRIRNFSSRAFGG